MHYQVDFQLHRQLAVHLLEEFEKLLGAMAPLDKLEGREPQIFSERDRKLEEARQQRRLRRQEASRNVLPKMLAMTGEWSALALS